MRAKKLKRPRYSASSSANWEIKVCEPAQANCSAPPLTICSSSNGQNHGSSGKTGAKAIAVQTKNKVPRRVPNRSMSPPTWIDRRRGRCRMRGRQSMPGRGPEMPETSTFGRCAEIPYDQMTPEQQEGYRLLIETRGALGGPNKVWVHNPKLAKVMGPLGAYFRTGYSLSEREREIAVVIINSKWHSIYPTNAHERAGKAAGLPADKVEAMLSGLPTSFDNKREQVVYEMATCLANSRWAGITDVIC